MTTSKLLNEVELSELGTTLVDALLNSASTDVISPKMWWDRAKSSLETGAAASETFGQMVSKCSKKLQIDALSGRSSAAISELATALEDPANFEAFRSLCQRDAIYITAITRALRDARKEEKKNA